MLANPDKLAHLQQQLARFARVKLSHTPTPLERLPRLAAQIGRVDLWVKRDDCTGLALGGNKSRQLEFYLGEALAQGADSVLSTGAVQSNYMRMLAAAAAKLGLQCHVQLEARVDNPSDDYQHSGNVLLNRLCGAHLHHFAHGEDERAADAALQQLAAQLSRAGRKPYIIPLGGEHKPTGALGYVDAGIELLSQLDAAQPPHLIVVASGSGLTQAGLLCGLRLAGCDTPVLGVCVRRAAAQQRPRVLRHCQRLQTMLGRPESISAADVWVDDRALWPGYGVPSAQVLRALKLAATCEGLLMDPVYSGKTLAGAMALVEAGELAPHSRIVLLHSGGHPGLFAYRQWLQF